MDQMLPDGTQGVGTLEPTMHGLQPATPVEELPAEDTDSAVDLDALPFTTTAEIEPLDEIVGQSRAMSALDVGLGIHQHGYNIFAAGLSGTGKMETIRRSLERRLDGSAVPDDWVYVHNFDDADQPWAIGLKPGQGRILEKEMDHLLLQLKEALPKAFRQQEFREEKEQLSRKYETKLDDLTNRLSDLAKQRGFEVAFLPTGQISFLPHIDGKVAEDPHQLETLPPEERDRLAEGERELAREVNRLMQDQRQMVQSLTDEVRDVERQFASYVVTPLIEAIKQSHTDNDRVLQYLDHVRNHVLDNLADFRERSPAQSVPPQFQDMMGPDTDRQFFEYQVNVIVDNSQTQTAPIIVEEAPTYRNLFGSIDRIVDRRGRLVTDFTQIKAGSLLRANGGYLIFNIEDALTEPFVYKNLKRTLKSGSHQLENFNPWLPFSTGDLRPEPIPINAKVVVVGNPMLYYLLRFYDEEFSSVFKIKADFGDEMPRGEKEQMQYARFVATVVRNEHLKPFDREAVGEIIRFGSKRAGDRGKLLTRFSETADLIREADYFAGTRGSDHVEASHVQEALESRIFRSDRIAEKIRELIEEGILLVDTHGVKVGQINGLAVADLGDYAFGRPIRVTAAIGLGSEGLINIEREARLSGRTHDKAVLIITGFLRNKYGQKRPLTLSASLAFEQTYSGIEGDSASAAEIYALISALAEVPLRQDIAITGSTNQWGQIQAIGGVNEKVEGFFDVCRTIGLTGKQGVCIPRSNVRNLILRRDVRQAIADREFHIYPIRTVDEGLELLTGFKAGSPDEEDTIHWMVDQRLNQMTETLKGLGGLREMRMVSASAPAPEPPAPPKLPDDQP
ncbi:MAG: Lon protease family protein [Solirubrobacterales bacterium]